MTEETATAEAEAAPTEGADTGAEQSAQAEETTSTGQDQQAEQQEAESQQDAEVPAYEPDLKAPEGIDVSDEARFASIKESVVDFEGQIAEAAGDRAQVRAVMDKFVNSQIQAEAERATAEAKAMNDTVEGWRKDSMKHPDFGGSKWPETEDSIAQVMKRFGSDDLGDLMTKSGIGNHPSVIQFMLNVHGSVAEADPSGGAGAPSSESKSHAQRIYG